MPIGQVLELGPFHFTVIRLLVLGGLLRVCIRRERVSRGINLMDRLMLIWTGWLVADSAFHSPFSSVLIFRLGVAFESLGIYWLMRTFIQNSDDFLLVGKIVIVLLVPLMAEMLWEKQTGRNLFGSLVGGIDEYSEIRNGKVRAQGPFAHSILAGTVGAVCLPLALLYWRESRKMALAGLAGSSAIVLSSASSGPLMTLMAVLGALATWTVRDKLRSIRGVIVFGIVALGLAMNDPVYYLIARIDLTGGSTGYYRAALIDAAIRHLSEWWSVGTDYTRHWLETGAVNPNHVDLVNHYIAMGVMGGLPLMLLFMGILYVAFTAVGRALSPEVSVEQQFLAWTLGSILFGHATTFISVSYYDQTIVFLYLLLAGIGSVQQWQPAGATMEPETEAHTTSPPEHDYPWTCAST
jgi:hypothetical protein